MLMCPKYEPYILPAKENVTFLSKVTGSILNYTTDESKASVRRARGETAVLPLQISIRVKECI
jgi:hypothetical protein